MNVIFPTPTKDLTSWAARMISVLVSAFQKVPEPTPGTISFWVSTVPTPLGWVDAGQEYQKSVSPALYKLLGEDNPGTFSTPAVTAPAGTKAIFKT